MSLREAGKAVLSSAPFRTVFSSVEKSSRGKRILNSLSGHRGVFSSFEEGWAAAHRTGLPGHEDPTRITLHMNLPERLRIGHYATLFWLSMISKGGIKLFDYGGNVGNLFYMYGKHLKRFGPLDWVVFDIPSVLEEGRRMARERKAEGLRFADSVAEFSSEQVLLVSGLLHYWEGTIAEFLQQFPVLPRDIIVTRSPFTENQESFVVIQHDHSCAFPCMVRNAAAATRDFAAFRYRLIDRWFAPEIRVAPPLFPDQQVAYYSGFYFHLQGTEDDIR